MLKIDINKWDQIKLVPQQTVTQRGTSNLKYTKVS
jgi:hypothetical protein